MHNLASDDPAHTGASADRGRITVSLPGPVAAAVRRMAKAIGGVSPAEVVRRGLILVDLMVRLEDDEELVVHNRKTNEVQRLRFRWNTLPDDGGTTP